MDDPGRRYRRRRRREAAQDATGRAGTAGIGLSAVLAFALAQGSWQWFATYIGVTLLAVIVSSCRPPARTPGPRSAYLRDLTAYSLVIGLCAAIALAPMLQRWKWLLPMPGTRADCPALGTYESIRTEAALADLADRDAASLSQAQHTRSHEAVADCLSATTTLWLPVYAVGVAVSVGLGVWAAGRIRSRRRTVTAT
ncbi:hypothetical protein [Streptomyces sp. NPDC055210]